MDALEQVTECSWGFGREYQRVRWFDMSEKTIPLESSSNVTASVV
jgi:hypothetical protein